MIEWIDTHYFWFLGVAVISTIVGFGYWLVRLKNFMKNDSLNVSNLFEAFGFFVFMMIIASTSWLLFVVGLFINIIEYVQAAK